MWLRGKPEMVAIGALMRWCYGVLQTGTDYCDGSPRAGLNTLLRLS